MKTSRMIGVLKRDGSLEQFDAGKLAGTMWRAMQAEPHACYRHARDLAAALGTYLARKYKDSVSSRVVFEATVKTFGYVGLTAAEQAFKDHQAWRYDRRNQLRVRQEDGKLTWWDKNWVKDLAIHSWHVSPQTGRTLAAHVESALLEGQRETLERHEVLDLLNQTVDAFGLADAVPVGQ